MKFLFEIRNQITLLISFGLVTLNATAHECEHSVTRRRSISDLAQLQVLNNGDTYLQLDPAIVEARMHPETEGKQRQSNWCWAACLQMALSFYGFQDSQEAIVERVHGSKANFIGSRVHLDHGIVGNRIPINNSSYYKFNTLDLEVDAESFINSIENAHPILLGMLHEGQNQIGHDYLVIGVIYREVEFGQRSIVEIKVLNPGRNAPTIEFLSWESVQKRNNRMLRLDLNVTHR